MKRITSKIQYLLGIDIGGTRVKTGIFDTEGNLLGDSRITNTIINRYPGWAEFSCIYIWENLPGLIESSSFKAGIKPEEITAVGFSTTCPALVAIDKNGNPLTNAIMNFDQRSKVQTEKVKKIIKDDEFFEITGNRILPGAIFLPGILWIKENEPEIYDKTFCFGTVTTFLINKLTGRMVLDYGQASFSGLFRTKDTMKWDDNLLKLMKIKVNLLPELLSSDKPAGRVIKEAAIFTGLSDDTIVAPGSADTVSSAIGIGFLETKKIFISSGTSEIISGILNKPEFDPKFLNRYYISNSWIFHGPISTAGAAINWLKRIIDSSENMSEKDFYDFIINKAKNSEIGAKNLFFLPYLQGERSPLWDSKARGVFYGLTLNTSINEICRAMFESIGFSLKQNIRIAEKLFKSEIKEIIFTGGGSRNTFWVQLKSNITGKSFLVNKFGETGMLGSAMLAGICSGLYKNHTEAVKRASRTDYIKITPDMDEFKKYEKFSKFYDDLYFELKDSFEKLSDLNEN